MASPDSLYQAIQSAHLALAEHSDPECKTLINKALASLLEVQKRDHAQPQNPGAAAVGGRY